jgi:hypothetical protein
VSQLGYMFLGLGVGGVAVGMFHLITHAFFKALLFLGAGLGDPRLPRRAGHPARMGGLRRLMPVTFATYAVGMMALAGVPLLFSGFWSKDEILHAAAWHRARAGRSPRHVRRVPDGVLHDPPGGGGVLRWVDGSTVGAGWAGVLWAGLGWRRGAFSAWLARWVDELFVNGGFDAGCGATRWGGAVDSRGFQNGGRRSGISGGLGLGCWPPGAPGGLGDPGRMKTLPWLTLLTFLPFLGCWPGVGCGVPWAGGRDRGRRVAAWRWAGRMVAVLVAMSAMGGGVPVRHDGRGRACSSWSGTPGFRRWRWSTGGGGRARAGVCVADGVAGAAAGDGVGEPAVAQGARAELYYGLLLFLQAGLFGTFTALNFFHWFLFWELSLVPAFFLIRLWGGPNWSGPASQFFVYTMVGSVAMLLAFLAIFLRGGKLRFPRVGRTGADGAAGRALAERVPWGGTRPAGARLTAGVFGWGVPRVSR